MSAPAKLAAFVVVLAALLGAGALAGDLIGSDGEATAAPLDDQGRVQTVAFTQAVS